MTQKGLTKEKFLNYLKFDIPFEIHTSSSDRKLGVVISQDGKPLAFCFRELNRDQRNYTTTGQDC